ncbi:5-carboxymethyl-2-hydroxymuconate isomerase [Fictibacillus macauensis ZFHKF-1]|uniref:5-carboxymethyl-2-hydroxymuconate isomerase n=1 Tax=Fictibacillus macauensis ZFHKF-1 TaxID=1196324 RepID=I8AG21_9BACL|nr:5-carboxymethyl-2-hydroxymuconate Delta-isomerase [Fictibacillus macauensis]EIT84339.1 5-carboxymethyl-2-hydroxymuconate isomerase [Fictibacillus macauensis ZFHKF-1]
MPHFIIEYTDNIADEGNFPALLQKINAVLVARNDLFPVGGIRSRAIPLHHYCIADGTNERDAFVHAHLKIGAGRSEQDKQAVCTRLFTVMKEHFAPLYETRGFALSMELSEFSESGTYKHNNLHARYKA